MDCKLNRRKGEIWLSIFGKVLGAIASFLAAPDQENAPLEPTDEANLRSAIPSWIAEVTQKNALPQTCVAIYIGLYEDEDGPTYKTCLLGSDEYDPNDAEWICRHDFAPAEPGDLDTGVPKEVWGSDVLDIVVDEVRKILESSAETILHQCPHVSVGFEGMEHIK